MDIRKNFFKFIAGAAALALAAGVYAGPAKVEIAIAKDKDSKPTDSFVADVPKLYAFFRSNGTKKGEKLRGVWIAEDVGEAAPANTKIDEAALTADQDNFFGAFSLSKPTKGWPLGKYRVEIYEGDDLAATAKFSIRTSTAKAADEDKDDDADDDESSND